MSGDASVCLFIQTITSNGDDDDDDCFSPATAATNTWSIYRRLPYLWYIGVESQRVDVRVCVCVCVYMLTAHTLKYHNAIDMCKQARALPI